MMELVQELFFTALVAIVFYFLVAKLVSILLRVDDVDRGSGSKSRKVLDGESVAGEVKLEKGLRIEFSESRKVRYAPKEEVSEKVDEFKEKGSVDMILGVSRRAERFVAGREVNDGTEVGKCLSGGIELPKASLEGGIVVDDPVEGEFEKQVNEVKGIDLEEWIEGSKRDEGFGVREEKMATGCLDYLADKGKIVKENVAVALTKDGGLHQVVENRAVGSVAKKVIEIEGQFEGREENMDLLGDEDDGWEGIERSELEKEFAKAANFVSFGEDDNRLGNLASDVQMQLYGLQKVAMEGPCHEPPPMALMVSARAKWNAWQRMGNMSQETAMEQYVDLLSDKVPAWMTQADSTGDNKPETSNLEVASNADPNNSISFSEAQENFKKKIEEQPGIGGGDLTGCSTTGKKDPE